MLDRDHELTWPGHRDRLGRQLPVRRLREPRRAGGQADLLVHRQQSSWQVVGVAVERRADAAAVAAPGVDAFLDRDGGDQQADHGVQPPGAGDRVAEQADQQRAGEIGAEDVLAALALGRGRADLVGDPLLGDPQQRHRDQAEHGQQHAEDADVGALVAEQGAHRLEGDVGREQEELDRDELLGALLGRLGEHARAGEAPDDDHAGEALDHGVQAEADERDRSRPGCRPASATKPSTLIAPSDSQDSHRTRRASSR